MLPSRRVIVFGSSSLALVSPQLLARVEVRPPASRGDLAALATEVPATVLILDGVFGSSLAVSPTECRQLLEGGWTLAGAASMGALRASELWSAGMIGFGDIFNLFRTGQLRSDADVAVILDAVTFRELTLSTVHIRSLLADAEGKGLLGGALARRMLLAARSFYWAERIWPDCKSAWRHAGVSEEVLDHIEHATKDPHLHPKARDGRLALDTLLARRWVPFHDCKEDEPALSETSNET